MNIVQGASQMKSIEFQLTVVHIYKEYKINKKFQIVKSGTILKKSFEYETLFKS